MRKTIKFQQIAITDGRTLALDYSGRIWERWASGDWTMFKPPEEDDGAVAGGFPGVATVGFPTLTESNKSTPHVMNAAIPLYMKPCPVNNIGTHHEYIYTGAETNSFVCMHCGAEK